MTVVVDASAYLDLLLDVVPGPKRGLFGGELVAPAIFHAEVAGGLASCERRGIVGSEFAGFLLRELLDSPVETVADRSLLERAFELRSNVSVYDACYVALAEQLGCGLLTADQRLANSPGLPVPVTLV
jgi:predicted nucleic acid-binding protein